MGEIAVPAVFGVQLDCEQRTIAFNYTGQTYAVAFCKVTFPGPLTLAIVFPGGQPTTARTVDYERT